MASGHLDIVFVCNNSLDDVRTEFSNAAAQPLCVLLFAQSPLVSIRIIVSFFLLSSFHEPSRTYQLSKSCTMAFDSHMRRGHPSKSLLSALFGSTDWISVVLSLIILFSIIEVCAHFITTVK
jgi:hypothetical protein